jgi:peptide/nickel transport system permease protein
VRTIRSFAWLLLAAVYLLALFPDFLSPYPPSRQHRDYPYARPGFYGDTHVAFLVREEPSAPLRLFGTRGTGYIFLLGTDEYGRDLYSRICHGASISLLLAPAALLFSLTLAMAVGAWAGYNGGFTDASVMRLSEVFLSLPWFYFVVALRAALPLHLSPQAGAFALFGLLGVLGWAAPARLFRGLVLSLKTREYILAARALGAGDGRIFLRHLLPALLSTARTQFLLSLPIYIITEVSLSFLGLGIVDPTPTWGNLLTPLQQYFVLTSYPWMFAPAAALVLVFLALHTIAGPSADSH